MTAIPKTPCPVRGLVPWLGGVWPIVARKPHPVLLWLYVIDQKQVNGPRAFHYNVSQEDIVKEMELCAKYKVGAAIQIGAFNMSRIMARKWDFERGMFKYMVEGTRAGRDWTMHEDEIDRRIKTATEDHA